MLRNLRIGVSIVAIVSALLQTALFFSPVNLACTLLALLPLLLYTRILPRMKLIQEFPLSTLSAYMFAFTNLGLPLIVSSLELRPITRNLVVPLADFGYMAILSIVVLLVYQFYRSSRSLNSLRMTLTRKVNAKLGLFQVPSATQLWIFGAFGLACLFYQAYGLSAKGAVGSGSILQKLLVELVPFAYAPFLIPLASLYSRKTFKPSKGLLLALAGHFGIILLAAVLRNDRSDFAMAAVVVIFSILVGIVTMRIKVRKVNYRIVVPVVFTLLVVYPLLADMALAMYVVRRIHSKQGARQQIGLTWEMFQQRDRLHEYMDVLSRTKRTDYDESYYNKGNVFLERFANMKFHDNGIFYESTFTPRQRADLLDFTIGNALAGLPAPVLSAMGIQIDKKNYNTMSVGDYFYYLHTGRGLGGFRVGSYIGHGFALVGWFFFPLFGLVMLGYFIGFDGLTHRFAVRRRFLVDDGARIATRIAYTTPIFAPVVLLNLLSVLNPYRLGSMVEFTMFLLRGMPQQIVVYAFMMWATRGAARWIEALRTPDERHIPRRAAVSLPAARATSQAND